MKNANKPISSLVYTEDVETKFNGTKKVQTVETGLTKREYFAGLAMQGLLSNPYPDIVGLNPDIITSTAIDLADKLLKQLDNG